MSLENHGGGVSSGALLQKCNVLNDATLNIASRYYPAASAAVAVAPGAGTFGTLQITATNAGDVSTAIINSINAVGNSVKTLGVISDMSEIWKFPRICLCGTVDDFNPRTGFL
eukprot:g8098.t1